METIWYAVKIAFVVAVSLYMLFQDKEFKNR